MRLHQHFPLPGTALHAELLARADHAEAANHAYRAMLQFHARTVRLRSGTLCELGLTHARLRILRVIASEPDISISQIARVLDLSRQAVHRVAHDLMDCGLIELETTWRDRRARIAKLTDYGRFIANIAMKWEQEWTAHLLRHAPTRQLNRTHGAINFIRTRLPWTVCGPDESALYFETS